MRACPTFGCTAAGNFFGIVLYDALYRLAALVGPAHHFLLKPFPALLFRWDCLVRRSLLRSTHCVVQHCRHILCKLYQVKLSFLHCRWMPSDMAVPTTMWMKGQHEGWSSGHVKGVRMHCNCILLSMDMRIPLVHMMQNHRRKLQCLQRACHASTLMLLSAI